MTTVGGPMFEPRADAHRESSSGKDGAHYNIYGTRNPEVALEFLHSYFPDGIANEMNFVIFSTSGIHGMYTTIEEVEADIRKYGSEPEPAEKDDEYHPREVTFLLVQPRIVGMTYGNVACVDLGTVAYLKKLRETSWFAVAKIGRSGR